MENHYEEYKSWFLNQSISDALGTIDSDWLAYVLKDEEGMELAVYNERDELIAVVGIVLPNKNEGTCVISNIAIKPSMFRKGIGSKVLSMLVEKIELSHQQNWVAYVAAENIIAQRFFEKNNWLRNMADKNEDMYKYELK